MPDRQSSRATARIIDEITFARLLPSFDDRDHQLSVPYLSAITGHNDEQLDHVVVEYRNEVIAVAAVRTRRLPMLGGVAVVAGGPVVAVPNRLDMAKHHQLARYALTSAYAEQGIRLHLRAPVLPSIEGWLDDTESTLQPSPLFDQYHTMVLDLSGSDEQRRAALSPQWRRNLRDSERAELELSQTDIGETWQRLRPMYEEMQDRKHFTTSLSPRFWDDVFAGETADQHFRGVIVHRRGRDVAGVIMGGDAAVATYLLGATTHAALPVRAGYLAMWAAIGLAKRAGHRFVDLGGVDREENPGGWQFKHGLRGRELSTPPPVVANPRGPRGRLIELAERAGSWVRNRRR